jgi:hypothetical protein
VDVAIEGRAGGRQWSWAGSKDEADARRREASELVGQRILAVRYFTIDYRRHELHPDLVDHGPRTIDDYVDWEEPTWSFDGFDAIDYGLEVTTDSGATFSLTWDPPGDQEGIGLQRTPMLGSAVRADADVAIWPVAGRSPSWASIVEDVVTGVDLHYRPWDEDRGSLWCPHITLLGERASVHIIMGDAQDGRLTPSADNIAVLHPASPLPTWRSLAD